MEIVLQSFQPYNLPFKQTGWVQRELGTLEKACIRVQSIYLFIYLKYVLKVLPVPLFVEFGDFVHVQHIE